MLVVDDMRDTRTVLCRTLEHLGHRVESADGGPRALALLASSEPFDLVLLDVEMPQMSGIEVLERIKRDELLRDIPVVMVSGISDMAAVSQCVALGADDFIHKPFDARLLKARVLSSLSRKRVHDWERLYLRLLEDEERRSQELISNMLPDAIAKRLKNGESSIAEYFDDVSVLFADLVGFTSLAAKTPPAELVATLNAMFSSFDALVRQHGLEKIKTIGDAYMVVGSLPEPRAGHVASIAALALDMVATVQKSADLKLRVGIHRGPAVAGVIGTTKLAYDVWGDTINIASRMESHGAANRIQVTEAIESELAGRFLFEPRGTIDVKGIGPLRTLWLLSAVD